MVLWLEKKKEKIDSEDYVCLFLSFSVLSTSWLSSPVYRTQLSPCFFVSFAPMSITHLIWYDLINTNLHIDW